MRVLFFSAESDLKGGGERFLLDVIDGLLPEYEIGCVCPAEGALAEALRSRGIEVFICPTGWNGKFKSLPANYLRMLWLAGKVRSFAPQVVYANGGHTNNLSVRLAWVFRCRSVVHVHDVFTRIRRDKYAFGYATAAIACSVGVADMVRSFHQGVKVVYNGVDTQKYSAQGRCRARVKIGVNDGQFVVGFVGAIVEKKGIAEFIDAARLIAAENKDAVFVVAGEPKPGEEEFLRRLKSRVGEVGLEIRFRWLGFVENLNEIMPGMDVLLFPAHYEAFGRVLIEAMACGVVPVSSFAGGPQEIIDDGKTGFLHQYQDVKSLASAVSKLYHDMELRTRMALAARAVVVERFSIASMLLGVKNAIRV